MGKRRKSFPHQSTDLWLLTKNLVKKWWNHHKKGRRWFGWIQVSLYEVNGIETIRGLWKNGGWWNYLRYPLDMGNIEKPWSKACGLKIRQRYLCLVTILPLECLVRTRLKLGSIGIKSRVERSENVQVQICPSKFGTLEIMNMKCSKRQHAILMDQLFSCWSGKDCCSFLLGERTMRD